MAQYLPRALSPGRWISIKSAQLIYIQLKAPACQFFSDCVWLITQQIGIEHAYPVLIELNRKM
jgi:hypothetical protein